MKTYENYKSLYMTISNDYKQIKKDIEQVHASEKKLTKDKHYYKYNKKQRQETAKKKYKEKMKNRAYRFKYLAKQREYNRKRSYPFDEKYAIKNTIKEFINYSYFKSDD